MEINDFEVPTAGGGYDRKQLEDNPNKRVCGVCGAVFNSGKALGGHMRIHNLASKTPKKAIQVTHKVKFKKKLVEIRNLTDAHQEKEVSPKCSLCPKTFRSLKSMYGHMRCHPERKWRGIQPPPDADATDAVDLAAEFSTCSRGLLVSWPASYKRSRITTKNILPVAAGNAGNFMDEDPEFHECVRNILHLSRAKIGVNESCDEIDLDSQSCRTETDEHNRVSESEASILQEFVDECFHHNDEMSSPEDDQLGSKITNQLEDLHIYVNPSPNEKVISFNEKKKIKIADLTCSMKSYNSMVVDNNKYACSFCPKSFPSYHGLGGHMSIHYKSHVIHSLIDHDSIFTHASASTSVVVAKQVVEKHKESKESGTGLHQCIVCKKVFSSGQALGGHKKCHRSVIEEHVTVSSANYTYGNLSSDHPGATLIEEPIAYTYGNLGTSATLVIEESSAKYVDMDIDLNIPLEEDEGS